MSTLHILAGSVQTTPAITFPNSTKLVITSSGMTSDNGGSVALTTPSPLLINYQSIVSKSGASLAPISNASAASNQGIVISGNVGGISPGIPSITNAANGNSGEVIIDFTLSSLSSGSPTTSLTFYAYIDGVLSLTQTTSALESPYTFTDVSSGTTYTFKMSETNASGQGQLSNMSNAVDIPFPVTITNVSLQGPGDAISPGRVAMYEVHVTVDTGSPIDIPITITSNDPLIIFYDGSTAILPANQVNAYANFAVGFFDGASHPDVYVQASVGNSQPVSSPVFTIEPSIASLVLPSVITYGTSAPGLVSTTLWGNMTWNLSLSDETIASLNVNSVAQIEGSTSSDPFTVTAFTLNAPQNLTIFASPSYQPSYSISVVTNITDYTPPPVLTSIDVDLSYANVNLGGNWLGYEPENSYGNMSENTTVTGTVSFNVPALVDTNVIIWPALDPYYPDATVTDPLSFLSFPDATANGDGTFTVTIPAGQTSASFSIVGAAGGFPDRKYLSWSYDYNGTTGSYYPWVINATLDQAVVTFYLKYNPSTFSIGGRYVNFNATNGRSPTYLGMSSNTTNADHLMIDMVATINYGTGALYILGATMDEVVPYGLANEDCTARLGYLGMNYTGSAGIVQLRQLSTLVARPESYMPFRTTNNTNPSSPYEAPGALYFNNDERALAGSGFPGTYQTYNPLIDRYESLNNLVDVTWFGGGWNYTQ